MKQRKLVLSLIVAAAVLVSLGVYRLYDGRLEDGSTTAVEAPGSAPQDAARRTSVDVAAVPGGRAPERGSDSRQPSDAWFGGRAAGSASTLIADPGDDPWRLAGGVRESRVRGRSYREAQRGQRTIVTSGRRIGKAEVRLPERMRAELALRDETSSVRAMVCVNRAGRPTEVRIADGTGIADVDASVARELLADRFRPLVRDGRRVAFCEPVVVIVSS